jgi:hypothetical protein
MKDFKITYEWAVAISKKVNGANTADIIKWAESWEEERKKLLKSKKQAAAK